VETSLDADPASETAQELVARWLALGQNDAGGNRGVQAGFWKAWAERRHWPAALQQRLAEFNAEAIARVIGEAVWTKKVSEFIDKVKSSK